MTVLRRSFLALAAGPAWSATPSGIEQVLRDGIAARRIPAVAAAVSRGRELVYNGAFGIRDTVSQAPVQPDSIFAVASMTKAVTTVAALQLVEQGKLTLGGPIGSRLPGFDRLQVLTGFTASGRPLVRPPHRPVTLRHLLTHTAGFGYSTWDAQLLRHERAVPRRPLVPPLMFDPGSRWEYGTNVDWVGRLVEAVSGNNLEAYFQRHILGPLGMRDTSFLLPESKLGRKVSLHRRQPDGSLKEDPLTPPAPPRSYNGGGGLYSTTGDYIRFMRMILADGAAESGERILRPASVALMRTNQSGKLAAGRLKTQKPETSADVDFHPGHDDRFTLGFLLNEAAYPGGRSAGSLAWAGIANTFYWIDPAKSLCAVVMMQFLPFCDPDALTLLSEFERAVYSA